MNIEDTGHGVFGRRGVSVLRNHRQSVTLVDHRFASGSVTKTLGGIKDPQPRADLLAFLREAIKSGALQQTTQSGAMYNMGGMMWSMPGSLPQSAEAELSGKKNQMKYLLL